MEIEIKIISRETIKPSSPTPKTLRKYQLSFLDQIAPPVFMPIVYFYPYDNKISNSKRANQLKNSLSQALARFYPFSGRLIDNLYVDCNNQGVPYVEAEANCDLSQILKNQNPKNLNKFLPYTLDDARDFGLAVQLNYFKCGGIAIALVISHKIADALSSFCFINSWAAIARNENVEELPRPKFESATLFPPRDIAGFKPNTGIVKQDFVTKIFTFPISKISNLRERYSKEGCGTPTRIEALSAFIWTRFVSATELKPDPSKVYTVVHGVNLRTRFDPPLSEYHFGNMARFAIAFPDVGSIEGDGGFELLKKVREAIRAVNVEFVAGLKEGENHLRFLKKRMAQANSGELVSFNFTSFCRFPLYEANFGWGKPAWVGWVGLNYKNFVTFVDTASCDGIDALINLKKEDMDRFEADPELQAFTSPSFDEPAAKTLIS